MNEREKKLSLWKPLLVGVLVTPLLFFVAAMPCGVGHGECRAFGVFFPLMLLGEVFGEENLSPMLLAAAQFPLAGLAFWFAYRAGRQKLFWAALLVFHAVGALIVFTL